MMRHPIDPFEAFSVQPMFCFYLKHTCVIVTLVSLIAGCSPPPRPSFSEISREETEDNFESSARNALEDDLGAPIPLTSLALPWETWHRYYIANKPVGFIHVRSEFDAGTGSDNVRTSIVDVLKLKRGPTTLLQSLHQTSIESRDGALLSFNAELRVGPARTLFSGQVSNDQLTTSMTRGDDKQTASMAWSKRFGGLAAVQQSLLVKPMKLGERRRLKLLAPVQYQMATVELECRNRASISTLEGPVYNAMEIEVKTILVSGDALESTVWIDDEGNLLKSYTPSLDLASIRATKELAEATIASPVDLFSVVAVDVKGKIENQQEAYRAGFLLTPKNKPGDEASDAKQLLSLEPHPGQFFRKQDDGSIQLLVSRDPLESVRDGFTTLSDEPTDEDLKSGPIIDSNAVQVMKLAGLSRATEPKRLATDLARTVEQLIAPGDFSRGFATASQTAQDSVGDCTERAVLLAAMLRVREIPSRVVAGLVYMPSEDKPRMAYHMWTLAWINEAWLPLDPTSGGLAPADRIAIATSNLADGNEYNFFSAVLTAIGKMDVEITNVKYKALE